MKYAINETVLAYTALFHHKAIILDARAEKQPSGHISHIYTLSILNPDGTELTQVDLEECAIIADPAKVDANFTHRKVKSVIRVIASETEIILSEAGYKADIEAWKEEVRMNETLSEEEKQKEIEDLDAELEQAVKSATKAKGTLPKLHRAAWSLLEHFFSNHIRIGHRVTPEIWHDVLYLNFLNSLPSVGADGVEPSYANAHSAIVPLPLAA